MKPILPRKASPKKDEAIVDIESLTNRGDGLGRIGQQAVFVPGTMPGDRVQVKLVKQKSSWAQARLLQIKSAAPERITPVCQHAGECGGCDWQHVPYQQQLDAKRRQFADVMQRIGGLSDLTVPEVVPCDTPYGYRNRIQGEVRSGTFYFRARHSGAPVAVRRCDISEEPINEWLTGGVASQVDGRIEVAIEDGAVVTHHINDQRSTELGFRQVNTVMARQLSALVHRAVEASECDRVFDLYCGRGDWAIAIAERYPTRQVTGIDSSSDNITIAQQRQRAQTSLSNTQLRFKVAKVEKAIKSLDLSEALCIVDPPRAGLDNAVIAALTKVGPGELVYVSCHPATLARDLKQLCASAYQVSNVELLDMFPQTAHLECFLTLKRRTA